MKRKYLWSVTVKADVTGVSEALWILTKNHDAVDAAKRAMSFMRRRKLYIGANIVSVSYSGTIDN